MAQPEKRENSVLFSLRELRQIEESRVQEEVNAQRSAEEARIRAAQEQERMVREAEEARVRAIHEEERMRREVDEARIREERIRMQEAETQARIRAQAELEQQRLAAEMQLKAQEVAKTRPTWLLAIAGFLVVAIGVTGVILYKRDKDANALAIKSAQQQRENDELEKMQKENTRILNELVAKSNAQDQELSAAKTALNNAQNAQDLKTAQARVAAAEARQAEAKAALARKQQEMKDAERRRKVTLSDECKNNPLGC